jgi:hypothetical protein
MYVYEMCRATLNAERGRAAAAVRTMEQTASTHHAELHTLQARLQRLVDDNHALAQEKHVVSISPHFTSQK